MHAIVLTMTTRPLLHTHTIPSPSPSPFHPFPFLASHSVGVSEEESQRFDQYACPQCRETKGLQSTMKKQCVHCGILFRHSASVSHKYGTDSCGIAEAQKRLQRLFAHKLRLDPSIKPRPQDTPFEALAESDELVQKTSAEFSERCGHLQEQVHQVDQHLRVLDARRRALLEVVRFADAFSASWRVATGDAVVQDLSSDEPICGLDARWIADDFEHALRDGHATTEESGRNNDNGDDQMDTNADQMDTNDDQQQTRWDKVEPAFWMLLSNSIRTM